MTRLNINSAVRTTPGDQDGSVLINLESGKVFSLNAQGAKIWSLLEEGISLPELIESVAQIYRLPHQQIQHDVEVFIQGLQRSGLVTG
jgi:uncharacterized protein YoaH (UPF0181 family)